jgi:hypothetical protein
MLARTGSIHPGNRLFSHREYVIASSISNSRVSPTSSTVVS